MLGWFRTRRRRKLLERPMDEAWRGWIAANVPGYEGLSVEEKRQLERDTRLFVAEKGWDGGNGVEVTDEVKVTIAAQACLMLVGFAGEMDVFPNVSQVVVLESVYSHEYHMGADKPTPNVLGHTYLYGPVYLSWDALHHGGRDPRDGKNLVLHEFAHKLDFTDGLADGTPVLGGRVQMQRWVQVMTATYEDLCERAEDGRPTLLDKYGATNPAEFFAVATECFFERGAALREKHRDVYGVLSAYYRQDPAAR